MLNKQLTSDDSKNAWQISIFCLFLIKHSRKIQEKWEKAYRTTYRVWLGLSDALIFQTWAPHNYGELKEMLKDMPAEGFFFFTCDCKKGENIQSALHGNIMIILCYLSDFTCIWTILLFVLYIYLNHLYYKHQANECRCSYTIKSKWVNQFNTTTNMVVILLTIYNEMKNEELPGNRKSCSYWWTELTDLVHWKELEFPSLLMAA